jgi:hypothetical protein
VFLNLTIDLVQKFEENFYEEIFVNMNITVCIGSGCFLGINKKKYIIYPLSVVPTNPHWARVIGYGLVSLCVIHKEGLGPSSGDIKRLMIIGLVKQALHSTADQTLHFGLCTALISRVLVLISNCKC